MKMMVTKGELTEIIALNNIKSLKKIFAGFGVRKNRIPEYYNTSVHDLLKTTLSVASLYEAKGVLAIDIAELLINRCSMVTNLFDLLELIAIKKDIPLDDDLVPDKLKESFKKNKAGSEVEKELRTLNYKQSLAMLGYIASGKDFEMLDMHFSPYIVQHIYDKEIIERDALLMYLSVALKEPLYGYLDEGLIDLPDELAGELIEEYDLLNEWSYSEDIEPLLN